MSRRRLPRRFPGAILALGFAIGAISASAALPPAWAQVSSAPVSRARESSARAVIGAPNAQACSVGVTNRDSSDATLQACDRALSHEQMSRSGQIGMLFNRGTLHMRRRSAEAALADYDAILALEANNAIAHQSRGTALLLMGRPGPAVASFTEALSLGVEEPHKVYYNRGAAREALGDLRGAYEDYSTALEIEPDWGPANEELARFVRTRREQLASMLDDSDTP